MSEALVTPVAEWPTPPAPMSPGVLTDRQRVVLDELETLVLAEGFSHLKLTGIAKRFGVSPTTLYTLASNKDDLLLLVLDRWYQRAGRLGVRSSAGATTGAERLQAWLAAAVTGARGVTPAFLRDMEAHQPTRMLADRYQRYFVEVLQRLLEQGAADGSLVATTPRLTAELIDAAMRRFADPSVLQRLGTSEEQAVAVLLEVVMAGLLPRGNGDLDDDGEAVRRIGRRRS